MDKVFNKIVNELKESIASKQKELEKLEVSTDAFQEEIKSIRQRIEHLESAGRDIIQNYSSNQDMKLNFKKRAADILREIENVNS